MGITVGSGVGHGVPILFPVVILEPTISEAHDSMASGRLPQSMLLVRLISEIMDVRSASWVGTVPVRSFRYKYQYFLIPVISPSSVGMVPSSKFV